MIATGLSGKRTTDQWMNIKSSPKSLIYNDKTLPAFGKGLDTW